MNEPEELTPISVVSKKPPLDKDLWDKFILDQQQKTPDRIEDAAKFVATMISVSLSLFLVLSGGQGEILKNANLWAIKAAIFIQIISLIASFFVLFPYPYAYIKDSYADIKRMHKKIVTIKYAVLGVSVVLFIGGLCVMGGAIL